MPLPSNRKRPHVTDSDFPGCDTSSNVKVVLRIRPQNSTEVEGNYRVVVQAVNENILVFDPQETSDSDYGLRKRRRDIRKRPNRDLKFGFDHVFGQECNNLDVFNATTKSVLDSFLDGYNCSVFAYGATGAGKTHTMLGSQENPGVIYQTMMALYERIDSMKDTKTCDVAVSYLEVYNETIRDLLVPKGVLPIREDPGKGVLIPGLSLHKPNSAEELLHMLQFGNQHRSQHPTDANAESSRSHAVFQVFVRQKDRTANISTEVRVAKMCLVDLAGSERATVTKNSGSRMREGANINRSLLALGNVINALAENKKSGFIPYRDSKLTRLLKDSLGGNCRTVMIAAVSPSAMSYEDTYNTLRYADRAKNIKATLKKNVLNVDFHMAKYGQIVEELRREIVELKGKLKATEERQEAVPRTVEVVAKPESFIGYQEELSEFFTGHRTLRIEQLQDEINLRKLQWKIYRKKRCLQRLQTLDEASSVETKRSVEDILNSMNQKSSCLTFTSESSRSKVKESCKQLAELEQKMQDSAGQEGPLAELLSVSVEVQKLQTELADMREHLGYTQYVVRCQEKELTHNERLLHQLLKLLKAQHYILRTCNLLTCELQEEYSRVQRRVGGEELCWSDETPVTGYVRQYTLKDMLSLPSLSLDKHHTDTEDKTGVARVSSSIAAHPVTNEEPASGVFHFTGTQASQWQQAKNLKVDECSPPKAKRVMVSKKLYNPPRRLDKCRDNQTSYHKLTTGSRTPSKTPQKHRGPIKNNTSTSNIQTKLNNDERSNIRHGPVSVQPGLQKTASRPVYKTPTKSIKCDDSPDDEPVCNSRLSRVQDTITKAKRFSHLHVHSQQNKTEEILDGTFTLDHDSTFTIDPTDPNTLPPSAIPCVDVNEGKLSQVNGKHTDSTVSQNYVTLSESVSLNKSNCSCHLITGSYNTSSVLINTQSCGKCAIKQSVTHTGSQDYGPENDSGASTIMNQSGNSQSSLVSISTLVDKSDLSQNLSNTDESLQSGSVNETKCTKANETTILNPSCTVIDTNKSAVVGSATVIKDKPVVNVGKLSSSGKVDMITSSDNHHQQNCQQTPKAARAIRFDDTENKCGKSYADVVRTPDRQPLKSVGNTSLSTPIRLSTDSELSYSDSSPCKPASQRQKENAQLLHKYGLPSLMEGSIISKGQSAFKKRLNSFTPGYMKPTKSHNQRSRNSNSNNSSLDTSDEVKPFTQNERKKIKNRPLLSHMRSKSMSNLSQRTGWQI